MKKTTALFSLLILLSLLSLSTAHAQVATRVRIIEASNMGSGIDPALKDLAGQISSLFSFRSYRLLSDQTVSLFLNRPVLLPLNTERFLELTLMSQYRETAEVRLKIRKEKTEILNTQVRLYPGRTVSIGGPKHGEGTLLIALSRL